MPVVRPVEDEAIFMNRKNDHSINVQAICDAQLVFVNTVAKWPGSTHDSFMWNDSAIKRKFDQGVMPDGWLVGDGVLLLLLLPNAQHDGSFPEPNRTWPSQVQRGPDENQKSD